jgi:hypothetical protein
MQQGTTTFFLQLSAYDDNSGVSDMRLGNSVEGTMGSAWQSYRITTTYVLTSGQVIYAQFRDRAGNLSPIYGSDGSTHWLNGHYIYRQAAEPGAVIPPQPKPNVALRLH